jgi:hypothetical protein
LKAKRLKLLKVAIEKSKSLKATRSKLLKVVVEVLEEPIMHENNAKNA